MAVRIGKVDLPGVQDLYTEEARTLVEQRVPEQQGSVFQDLGREPLTLVLEGLLFGEEALTGLEELRQAQSKAKPLPFAANIAVGAELTDVLIEDLRIRQVAGYQQRYRFTLRLREYVAPPHPALADLVTVKAGIRTDADAWGTGALAAAKVLQNPAGLPAMLAAMPSLLDHLSATDLGSSILRQVMELSSADLGNILNAVSKINPDFLKALKGGPEFLLQLKAVAESAEKLVSSIEGCDPLEPLRPLLKQGG